MLRLTAGALVLLLFSDASFPSPGQEIPAAEHQPKSEFFSGTIGALDESNITVIKTVLGKPKDTRTFLITKETRIEGNLKLKVRVTVRYTHDDEGNHATHIIVRTSSKK